MKEKSRIVDLVNFEEKEVQYATFFTILLVILLRYVDFYNNFEFFVSNLSSIYTCIIGAMIAILGFSLSGIAIIAGLFPSSIVIEIDKENGAGTLKYLLSSYVFLAKNVAMQCIFLIAIYFATFSTKPKLSSCVFWILVALELYHICFVIFYTVSLVLNCVKLYEIKNIYERSMENKISMREKVTNIQIDFILSTLANICKMSPEKAIENLLEFVEKTNLEDKDEIIEYLKKYYRK